MKPLSNRNIPVRPLACASHAWRLVGMVIVSSGAAIFTADVSSYAQHPRPSSIDASLHVTAALVVK